MTTTPSGPATLGATSALGVLGIGPNEERLYRAALRHCGEKGRTVAELAELAGTPPSAARMDLTALVERDLLDEHDGRILARPPEPALSRLIAAESRRLRDQLDAARGLLPSLRAEQLSSTAPKGAPVPLEIVEGGDVLSLIRALAADSTGDLLWLRPDPWRTEPGRATDDWAKEQMRAGRGSRALYPARVLTEAPQVVRERAAAGEHARILAEVPFRLAIMGSAVALIPERLGVDTGRRIVVRQGSMIDALRMLFDSLWNRALSVPGLDGTPESDRSTDRALLLDQLAAGVKDEQIARALGLSLRTIRRRVSQVMDELGVDSRFQAGVEAVRRGWI
ncbi:MAG: helix-turn-helix domain-containing protein [Nocardioidaceae bacterium]